MTKHFPDDMVTVPLGRPGVSEEVASFVLFLASDESSYSTGAEFVMAARQPSRLPGSTPSRIHGAHITAVMPRSSARRNRSTDGTSSSASMISKGSLARPYSCRNAVSFRT
jgi:hypothetical protein